jgi:hypothetical protein
MVTVQYKGGEREGVEVFLQVNRLHDRVFGDKNGSER